MHFTEIKSLKRIHKVHEGIGTDDILETPGIIHPSTGEKLTVREAISYRILDVRTGRIVTSDGSMITIDEAVSRKLIDPKLAECLSGPCGTTEDGRSVSLLEAIQREIYDAEHGVSDSSENRIKVARTGTSIANAIDKGKVDVQKGDYILDSGAKITLSEAYDKGYLVETEVRIKTSAVCLHDALVQGLVDEKTGWIVDRNSGNKFQIDAAIKQGLIDRNVREIVDPRTDNKVTLIEALEQGIVNPKLGKFINVHEKITFQEAKRRQLIVKPMTLKDVCDKNLYDETGKILSPLRSSKLSILEAISRGVLDCDTIKSITDTNSNELLTLSESLRLDIIQPDGHFRDALTGEVCTIPVAVERGLITSVAQKSIFDIEGFKNPDTGDYVSFNSAYSQGLISKKSGGSLITDLKTGQLVPLKQATETNTVKPQVFSMLERGIGIYEKNNELSVLEAVFKGYIDPKTGNIINLKTNKPIPINEAIKLNIISPEGAALLNSLLSISITSQTISKIVKRYCTVTQTDVKRKEIKMTFVEAVRRGLIDETTQTFTDPDTNEIISIQDALNEGIIGVGTTDDHEEFTTGKFVSSKEIKPPMKVVKITKQGSLEAPSHKTTKIMTVIEDSKQKNQEPDSTSKEHQLLSTPKPPIKVVSVIHQPMEVEPLTTVHTKSVVTERKDTKTVTTDFLTNERQTASEKQVFELPPEGWFLSDAITHGHLDPVTGLFIIPGTDRLVSFEECVKLRIINPISATVIDPSNQRIITLFRSLEKHVLDSTGHYKTEGKLITMKEAIENKFIILEDLMDVDQNNQRLIQITKVTGKPDLVEVSNVLDKNPPTFTKVKSTDSESSSLEPIQITPGVIYDPGTALVIFTESGKSKNVLEAVKEKKIQPQLVNVKDPYTGKEMTITDAIRKGVIDKDTGDYKDKSGRKISLNDAAKFGVLSLIGSPLVAAAGVVNIIRNAMIVDPNSGEEIPMEVAYERGLVDEDAYKQYEAQASISIAAPTTYSKSEIVSTSILIRDPETGKQLTPEEAIEKGVVTPEELKAISEQKIKLLDTTSISLDEDNLPSAADKTRERITTEPKYKVAIGRAKSFSQSPEREAKPVVLQKMRKKIVKPKDALQEGLIDEATADILGKEENFRTAHGESLNLSEAISNKKLDGDKGAIIDPERGDILTINEAMSRGILDPSGTNQLHIPLNKSLSVPELIEQGLLEPDNCKVVHPETGSHLTLHEAIVCNIVDPLSKLTNVDDRKVTLEQAIVKGDIDDDRSEVKTKEGFVDLLTAVEHKVFDPPEVKNEALPPAGMTFPVALKRGLVDPEKQEIIHPITGVRKPIEDAIKENFIMALPCPISPDSIEIDKALSQKLIDAEKGTFTNPKTGELIPINEAVESGLLVIKSPDLSPEITGVVTSVTETITSYHTVTTKTIELLSGYVLMSTKEVKDLQTGEIIPIEEARKRGIVRDEKVEKENFTTREIKMSFSDALKKGLVDMKAGTYTSPETGKTMSISSALQEGILDDSTENVETNREITETDSRISQLTLMEAYEHIYDEEAKKFRDPNSPEKLLTFSEALEKNIIDPTAVIYDTTKNQPVSVQEAVNKGLIDAKSGQVKDSKSGSSVNIKEAAKMGLLAIVGAPILAGMKIAEVVKSAKSKSDEKKEKIKKEPSKKPEPKPVEKMEVAEMTFKKEIEKVPTQKVEITSRPTLTKIPTIEVDQVDNAETMDTVDDEVFEKPYERMPLELAISKHLIEPKICRILQGNQEWPVTVQDALNHNQLKPEDIVDIVNRNQVYLIQETPQITTVAISRHLKPEELAAIGCFDPTTNKFIDPHTGTELYFQDFMYSLDIFDPENILVKDLNAHPSKFVSLREALERPLIDPKSGYMVDPKTGKRVSFFDAIKLGWIIERKEKPAAALLSIEDALQTNAFDPQTGQVYDPSTGEVVTFSEAVKSDVINPDNLLIRDPKNNELIPFDEAVANGIVDLNKGVIINIETKKEVELAVAFIEGYILTSFRKPISLEAVVNKGLYNPSTGLISDPLTKQDITLDESIKRSIVDPEITKCKDAKANEFLKLNDAIQNELVDPEIGKMRETTSGAIIPFDSAIQKGLLTTQKIKLPLVEAVVKNYYSPKSGKILNPITGNEEVLRDSIEKGFVEVDTTTLKDDRKGKVLTFKEAKDSGLIDTVKGMLTYPILTLDEAVKKGYILSTIKPWSLQEALAQNCYDPKTGLLLIDDVKMSIQEAIQKCLINPDCLTIKDPKTGEMITLTEAIKAGILNPKTGKIIDPYTGNEMSLSDALERGLIIPSKRKFSLPEAVFKGFYDPQSGKFSNPQTVEKLQTDRAIRKGFIDPQSTLVNINGTVTTFEKAVDDGIIDTKQGTVKDRNRKIDFREAFDQGLFIEARKPLSLSEAIVKGVFDPENSLFLDPQTGEYITLKEAIASNVIDSNSVKVKDTRSGAWKQISLVDAIKLGFVNGDNAEVKDLTQGDSYSVGIIEAFNIGLIEDSKAPVSVQRAIHQGLYDEKTGKFSDPTTGNKITLHEAIRRFIINPLLPCYWDEKSERLLNLNDTCRLGIIDKRSGNFKLPNTNHVMSLSEALDQGFIIDIETLGFGLYETIGMGLYDPVSTMFVHPSNQRKLTLKQAVKEDLVNPNKSLVKHIKSGKYVDLNDAISQKIIDDELGIYNLPNGNIINLIEARDKGLIVTTKKLLSIEEAMKNGLYRPDTGKFVDPSTGEYFDLSAAINVGLIDPNTTVLKDPTTGKIKSLKQAIEEGDIDVSRGKVLDGKLKRVYNLDKALEKGILITVDKTKAPEQIDVTKVQLGDSKIVRECTVDEAIKFELLNPETSLLKEPQNNKFLPLKEAIENGLIDVNKKARFEPQTGKIKPQIVTVDQNQIIYLSEPLTFEQAIDHGHLDVSTGKFTDPQSKEVLTLKETVGLGLIDPDTALVKDGNKKKLIKLPDAFRRGLMDSEKANVLDTVTSKLYPLSTAIDNGLVFSPNRGICLIESLTFGLYNPITGGITNPFLTANIIDRKRLTLNDSIECGLIDPTTTVVKDPETGSILPLHNAIETRLIDATAGRLLDKSADKQVDLLKAYERGLIVPAEARVSFYFIYFIY